jgi:type II secretory pathway predicted ATPase ExeA
LEDINWLKTIEDAKGTLTIIMVGHPKLGNDLNRPAMEEIGARAKLFSLDSWGQQKRRYIEWVLEQCSKPKNQFMTSLLMMPLIY